MALNKPSYWAAQILSAKTDKEKSAIFKTIPENFRAWVIDLVVSTEELNKKRPRWLTARIKMKQEKKHGTAR